jgi:hypothetical protein
MHLRARIGQWWRRRAAPCPRCAKLDAILATLTEHPEWLLERDATAAAPAKLSLLDSLPRCAACAAKDFALETLVRFAVKQQFAAREAALAAKDAQIRTLRGELAEATRSAGQTRAIVTHWVRPTQGAH